MTDEIKSNPTASAQSSDPSAEYLARALYEKVVTLRSVQSFLPPTSREWRQYEKKINTNLLKLERLSELSKSVTHKSKPIERKIRTQRTKAKSPPTERQARKLVYGSQDDDIIRRRGIVSRNPLMSIAGLCQLFDSGKIPLPRKMKEAETWVKAYNSPMYRHAIESLISRDRKKAS